MYLLYLLYVQSMATIHILAADPTSWQCRVLQVAKDANPDIWARGSVGKPDCLSILD